MKKLFALLFLFFTFKAISQTLPPTTEEEYNYVTKGYKIQIESGLDQKAGYEFRKIQTWESTKYTFDFRLLVRTGTKQMAAIMVIAKSKVWNNIYYLCIPQSNTELMNKYVASLANWDGSITYAYAAALSAVMSDITATVTEYTRKQK